MADERDLPELDTDDRNFSAETAPATTPSAGAVESKPEKPRRGGGGPRLWGGILLVVVSLWLLYVYIPGGVSDVKRGVKVSGQVQLADSRPGANGQSEMTVTFVFQDSMRRNHRVTKRVLDAGKWSNMKPGKDIEVWYKLGNPESATVPGGEGMASPHGPALSMIGWTALVAGIILASYGYLVPKAPKKKTPQMKVTMTRR